MRPIRPQLVLAFWGLLLAMWACGCGGNPAGTGTLSGGVTLKGQPLSAGIVQLVNSKSGTGGSATLDASGKYQMTTPLPVGEYQVAVQGPPPPAPHEMASAPKSVVDIPAKFRDSKTSGLSVTIKEGPNTADFKL